MPLRRGAPTAPWSRPGTTTPSADLDPDLASLGTSTTPTGASAPTGLAPTAPPFVLPLVDRLRHARPVTVLAVRAETPTAIAVEVERPPGFRFRAGQFAAVTLRTDSGPDLRQLSIASSPHDPTLQFATRIVASAFRRALADLEPGDTVQVSRPRGTFRVQPFQPAVFVTGGMGITPVRSILRATGHRQPVQLLYGTHGLEEIVFRRELEQLAAAEPKFEVTWLFPAARRRRTSPPLLRRFRASARTDRQWRC